LLSKTCRHPLDLTPSVSTPMAGRSHRPRRPSMNSLRHRRHHRACHLLCMHVPWLHILS
jgi:hypothetical protein